MTSIFGAEPQQNSLFYLAVDNYDELYRSGSELYFPSQSKAKKYSASSFGCKMNELQSWAHFVVLAMHNIPCEVVLVFGM